MKRGRLIRRARSNCAWLVSLMIDAVVPPKDRALRAASMRAHEAPLSSASLRISGMSIATLMPYRAPAAEDLIRALKYDGSYSAARVLAELLADYLAEEIAALRLFSARDIALVPLPLHPTRLKERGFNQIERVLDYLPEPFHDGTLARIEREALIRTRATRPQATLSKREREQNVKGAFALAPKAAVSGTHVFLIDDVATTGATLSAAAKPLAEAGAEVSAIAFSRA